MAKVLIEEIVGYLGADMRRALEDTVRAVLPDSHVDGNALFTEFKAQIARCCRDWERVPNRYVDAD